MDLVIAVVVFGFIAVIFYSLLTVQQRPSIEDLQGRAQSIEKRLSNGVLDCGPVIANASMTLTQLQCLYKQDPIALRQALGVPGNFCIYVEDTNHTILVVSDPGGSVRTSVGDNALIVAGTPCGSLVS